MNAPNVQKRKSEMNWSLLSLHQYTLSGAGNFTLGLGGVVIRAPWMHPRPQKGAPVTGPTKPRQEHPGLQ